MPETRRLYRRITDSHLPTRMIAHISVVGLVILASAAGFTQATGSSTSAPNARAATGFLSLVSAAQGVTADSPSSTPSVHALTTTHPADDFVALDRGAPAQVPLPTPFAIDPDATPLAAPTGIGDVATANGPSSRGGVPGPASGQLSWPVPGGSYSQHFHAGHLAVDIAAPYGSQVVAAQGGVVTSAGWRNNGGGNVISIDHGNGIVTVYNHLGSIWVGPGQYVGIGQGIGGVGCTGLCTGPHVHFEVIVNGIIDNPQRYF